MRQQRQPRQSSLGQTKGHRRIWQHVIIGRLMWKNTRTRTGKWQVKHSVIGWPTFLQIVQPQLHPTFIMSGLHKGEVFLSFPLIHWWLQPVVLSSGAPQSHGTVRAVSSAATSLFYANYLSSCEKDKQNLHSSSQKWNDNKWNMSLFSLHRKDFGQTKNWDLEKPPQRFWQHHHQQDLLQCGEQPLPLSLSLFIV